MILVWQKMLTNREHQVISLGFGDSNCPRISGIGGGMIHTTGKCPAMHFSVGCSTYFGLWFVSESRVPDFCSYCKYQLIRPLRKIASGQQQRMEEYARDPW